jgi:hypothetical protein
MEKKRLFAFNKSKCGSPAAKARATAFTFFE